jgi:tetratricopeptide (TPR) repeat protein
MKMRKYEDAAASINRVFSMLPSYSEAYRISSLQAGAQGDFYKAAEELDKALEYSPKSAIIYYQYAQLALSKLDDATLALEKIDRAIELDKQEDALQTLRALTLVRLGKCAEAARIYESLLLVLDSRARKWRITTRDQASECYRRLAEQNTKMREIELAKADLDRALGILESAIARDDFDERMGRLYVNVVEDALFIARATSNQAYATAILQRYDNARQAVTIPSFQRFSFESLSQAIGSDPWISEALTATIGRPPSRPVSVTPDITKADERKRHGKLKTTLKDSFGFITSDDQDWFFHRSDLVRAAEWAQLAAGSAVLFDEGADAQGRRRAIRVIIES